MSLVVDPLTEFLDAIRSPQTKQKYEKRLDLFFKTIKIDGPTLKDRASLFASRAQKDNSLGCHRDQPIHEGSEGQGR